MPTPPLSGVTILVVEDNEDHSDIAQSMLEHLGAHVTIAANGAEGRAKFLEGRPDLALVDIMMPVMDGLEFARKVRSRPECSRARLVALTALRDDTAYIRSWAAGYDGHLEKPVTFEKLEGLARFLSVPKARPDRSDSNSPLARGLPSRSSRPS
jgi:CheY-like chemotaxis protein